MRRSFAPSKRPLGGGSGAPSPSGIDCDGAEAASQELKRSNVSKVLDGSISVVRAPLLSCLSVPRKPFKPPEGARRTSESDELLRRKSLGVRRVTTLLGPSRFRAPLQDTPPEELDITGGEEAGDGEAAAAAAEDPGFEPLVLWESDDPTNPHSIEVDPRLCKFLRPHQREGVEFMFRCVMGLGSFEGEGCILADDMGLGKTLQSIALMWTLLKQGTKRGGPPAARRAVVVCPTSLVKNWEAEIEKWLQGECRCLALSETSRDQVISSIGLFLSSAMYRVLIISYETFRLHASRFQARADSCCDLLVCDEAHRLKNAETATNQALSTLKCRRRVLLSGTPMQNDLAEFFAMVDFTNPGVLGNQQHFRRHFLAPILAGREPDASNAQQQRAQRVQNEMSTVVNEFILRRTNTLNAKHLPPKLVQVVCCRLTDVQRSVYAHLLSSKEIRHILQGKQTNVLSNIGSMQKLCNHPSLLQGAKGMEDLAAYLPGGAGGGACGRSGGIRGGTQRGAQPEWSGKLHTLFRLMRSMRQLGDDRIVVVSNYTQTLDLIGVMCRENGWPYVRLDGSTGVSKRQKLVDAFNDPVSQSFAFLLSSKAGGCGLNLIGGNRLVLFDPDWNPAVDKQAAARVWRDGQRKRCFVYRFMATGTIEEKIFQRQLSKEGLQNIVDDKQEVNSLSSKDLKNLFRLRDNTPSDTHDKLKCSRCVGVGDAALQAARDDAEEAERVAVPRQLERCGALLAELRALPRAEALEQPPPAPAAAPADDGSGAAAGAAAAPAELMGFAKVATKLQNSEYAAVPAFARDMNAVFGDVRRAWGMKAGEPHPSLKAATELQPLFEEKWRALAPPLMQLKAEALEEVLTRHTAAATEAREAAAAAAAAGGDDCAMAAAAAAAAAAAMPTAEQRFQEQLGMPKEEDLNSWSHHYTTDTTDDPVFRAAMAGTGDSLVSFVFGLEVTWDLLQAQMATDAEEAAATAATQCQLEAAADEEETEGSSAKGKLAAKVATPAGRKPTALAAAGARPAASGGGSARGRRKRPAVEDDEEEEDVIAETSESEDGAAGDDSDSDSGVAHAAVEAANNGAACAAAHAAVEADLAAGGGAAEAATVDLAHDVAAASAASSDSEDSLAALSPRPSRTAAAPAKGKAASNAAAAGSDTDSDGGGARHSSCGGASSGAAAAASPAAAPSPSRGLAEHNLAGFEQWSCRTCTFLNPGRARRCEVCDVAKGKGEAPAARPGHENRRPQEDEEARRLKKARRRERGSRRYIEEDGF